MAIWIRSHRLFLQLKSVATTARELQVILIHIKLVLVLGEVRREVPGDRPRQRNPPADGERVGVTTKEQAGQKADFIRAVLRGRAKAVAFMEQILVDEPFGALAQQTRLLMGDELLRLCGKPEQPSS